MLSGTFPHTHLLVMSLNGAKCNLDKVKLETMLARKFYFSTANFSVTVPGGRH